MRRYLSTRKKRDKSNIVSYTTTMYPPMPIENSDIFIVTTVGDRLDTLAHRYYGDFTLWWVIAKANGIKGKIAIDAATDIRIPGNISTILENFRNLNLSR